MLRAIQSERDAARDIDCVQRALGRRESEALTGRARGVGSGVYQRQYAGWPQTCAKGIPSRR